MHTHYGRLLVMAALSFIAMYILMYAMTDALDNVFANVNQLYMAGLMAAPMVVIELLLMKAMFPNKKLNGLILITSLVAMALFYTGIRKQTAIDDTQFIRSMIPHHSGAILMCNEATITDPELLKLCESISRSQQAEISQMKAILARLTK